ncbi:MAG: Methylcrotonyl-CoA carboxylase carboxyl transferase subunit (EC [uncultured Aureispira sp.]|uniref:Methylcrotonyl-CoA carboxylase carboxyl transferase subunit (EC) n=1 Tax=uncultured Aureispira sp. TaxID=1331704 RepID=A0A6S6S6B7_9BACT|nr:MAG: Methylcrotonyl-CoA carboxylase carboxyl transferase subunit (EC [uncultured Aureispira sp.]
MRPIKSAVHTNAQSYQDNYEEMSKLVEKLEGYFQKSLFQGKEKHLAKARKADKLLARERIELLLDQDSFFLELLPLIGLKGEGFGPGGTAVCGIGLVAGRLCMLNANVGSNRGGSIDKATLEKSIRMSEIAMENGLPVLNLVESSGANLPEQEQIFNYGGTIFREITRRSRKGFPTISVVFGNSTAGGAYIPGMSDYTIMVKKKAKVFLAGPPLVKMATNEVTDDEALGGAEMHSSISGVSDYLAENEQDAIRLAREIIEQLKPPHTSPPAKHKVDPPLYDAEELLGIVPADIRKPIDARELIARIVDGSRFSEFKPNYGATLITGYAEIHGYKIGILANNGVILSEAANKATHFIQLCNQNNIPLLYLQNTTGFMVGRAYEEGGIIKDGAKMLNAVSNSDVPSITIMIGASYGAGNYAMNGRAYQPRFLFSYPNSKIAVMGPQQLSGVMEIIQRAAAKKAGIEYDEEQAVQLRQYMIQQVEKSSTAWYATSQGWDDGVIDPRETRNYLAVCLATIHNQPIEGTKDYGVFRM